MSKKILGIALKVLISGALIFYAVQQADLEKSLQKIQGVDVPLLLLGAVCFYFQLLIGGLRWQAVNKAIGVAMTFAQSIRIFFIGMFFNQALPGGTGGDAVRVYLAFKSGLQLRGALNGVMLERLGAVVALILLVDIAQPFLHHRIDAEAAKWSLLSAAFLTVAAVGGIVMIMAADRVLQEYVKYKIVRGLGYLSSDTRAIFCRPIHAAKVLFLGLAGNVNISICVFILSQSLGLEITLLECLLLVPPVLLIAAIPISVGGWGVREMAMVNAFGLIGVGFDGALALSVLTGLVGIAVSLPGGLVWLFSRERGRGTKISEIEAEISADNTERA